MQKLRTHKIDRTNEYRRTCVVLILQRAHLVSDGFALFAAVPPEILEFKLFSLELLEEASLVEAALDNADSDSSSSSSLNVSIGE